MIEKMKNTIKQFLYGIRSGMEIIGNSVYSYKNWQ